jgi:hypothetical protein
MKVAVGEKVAGKFQYNRFAALMNNQDYYDKAYSATQGADGAMDIMNDYYVDSIEGRLKSLQAAGEGLISSLFDQDAVEPMLESVTELVNNITTLTENLGGLDGVLSMVGGTFLRVFSSQIGEQVRNVATSISSITTYGKSMKDFDNSVSMLGFKDISDKNHTETSKFVTSISSRFGSLSEGSQQKIRETAQGLYDLELKRKNASDTSADLYNKIENNLNKQEETLTGTYNSKQLDVQQKRRTLGLYTGDDTKKQLNTELDELKERKDRLSDFGDGESIEKNYKEASGKLENLKTIRNDLEGRQKLLREEIEDKTQALKSNTVTYDSAEGTTVQERTVQAQEIKALQEQLDELKKQYQENAIEINQAQEEEKSAKKQ